MLSTGNTTELMGKHTEGKENRKPGMTGSMSATDIVYIGMFAVLMAICSWISIPASVPFTLQTFGVFVACVILGARRGFFSVLVFLLLGAVGMPVFSGFKGGVGVLFGTTGGYLIGFLFTALVMLLAETIWGKKAVPTIAGMVIGLIVCYAFGTAWFMFLYAKANGVIGVMTALTWCVFPFIIPDIIKIALAYIVGSRMRKYVKQ